MKKETRIIVDTNIWISFLIGRQLSRFIEIISHPNIQLVFSEESFEELHSVVQRAKFAKYFTSSNKAFEFINYLEQIGLKIRLPNEIPTRCRDPKDDYLLELAILSEADFIITGDKDLLTIAHINNCQIVTVIEFELFWFPNSTNNVVNEPLIWR